MASKRTRKRKRGQTTLDDVVNDQPSMKRIKSTRPPLLHNVAEVGSRDSRPRRVSRRRDKAFSAEPKRSINPYRLRSSSRLHSNYVSNNESTDLDAGGEDDTEVDVDIHDRGEIDESYESQHQLQPSPTTMSTKMSKEMSISQSFTPESLTSPTPKMSTMAQNISNIRSQPSTPKRSKIKKRSAKLSKSARRKSPNKRRTSRLPTEESDCESAVESDIESGLESGFEIEATSFEELDRVLKRKKTPNWKESQDSIDPEPTESAKPSEPDTPQKTPYHIIEMDDSQDTPTNHSREGYSRNRVVPVMTPMTDPVTHKYGYSGIHVPFGVHPPSYSMNLNMSHHSVHSVHSVHSSHSLRYGLNHNGSIRNNNALGPGTPRPGRYDVDDNHDNKLNKPTEDIWSISYWSRKLKQNGNNFKGKLVFALIGFLAGVAVAYSGFQYQQQRQFQIGNPVMKTLPRTLYQGTCSCDATSNTSTVQCSPCMDEYWALHSEYKQCHEVQVTLQQEMDQLKEQMDTVHSQKCKSSLTALRSEVAQCSKEKDALQRKVTRNTKDNVDGDCAAPKAHIRQLEHELGECNVEWGACQQVGRQKDKLDEKRMEEIERQKKRFTLCNDQLKRYKETAKQQKANR